MKQYQEIIITPYKSVVSRVEDLDSWKFTPHGRFQGIQRWIWNLFLKKKLVTNTTYDKISVERVVVRRDDFLDYVEQVMLVSEAFDVLYVGYDEWEKILGDPRVSGKLFDNHPTEFKLFGARVVVLPYMKGILPVSKRFT